MKDYKIDFEVEDKKYSMIFNLNVMQNLQKKYGSIQEWVNLIDKSGTGQEPDFEAIIFGLGEMINEGIDIDNDENDKNNPLLSEKQIGRLITKLGIKNASEKIKEAIVEGTKNEKPKNE